MICKERGRHRFKPSLREQMMGAECKGDYNRCFDCGFKRESEEKGEKE